MKLCKKALSASLAVMMLLTAMFSALPAVSAETSETQLTLETEENKEPGMDAPENADWIADNLMLDATVTVSGNPANPDSNSAYKTHLFDGEASSEWTVGESQNNSNPSIPKVVVEFDEPKTVKEVVLANSNNPTRYIMEAKITLTDKDGNTYVYTADGIHTGGIPYGYVFSNAVNNVVKVEIVATKQEERNGGALTNGFSYVGILDKRYDFTENKVYYAKNYVGNAGVYDDSDGLAGVLVPSSAETGFAYNLPQGGSFTGRSLRLPAGDYKVTLYAKLSEPAADENKTVLKLKWAGKTINFNRSDFTAIDEYVKIEKYFSATGGDTNSALQLEYQEGSGVVKLDRILVGLKDAATPEPVQPLPPEEDPNELPKELPGVSGDEYDPDGKTWIEANLLKQADPEKLVNSVNDKAAALYDGNEAVSWVSDRLQSVVTADFSALEVKPEIKKVILVAPYTKDGGIINAKITFTTTDGEEKYCTAKALRTQGGANEITLENAVKNVEKVVIESLDNSPNGGWAEVALLDKRYTYERSYYVEYLAEKSEKKETGVIDPPSGVTVEDMPAADWPRGIYNDLSVKGNYMIWSPQLNIPAGDYTVSVYAKVYDESTVGAEESIFNIQTFEGEKPTTDYNGKSFTKAKEYEIITHNFNLKGFYKDRISIWSYNTARFKVHKIVVHTDNMKEMLPEPPKYTPTDPGEEVDKPGKLDFKYFIDPETMVTLPYRIYLPTDYSADKKYSFLLFLHGAGERGYGDNHFENVKIIDRIMNDPEASKKFIIVAPQCAPGKQWVDTPWANGSYNQDNIPMSTYLTSTYNLIRNLEGKHNIDATRMYITGYSMGGYGTWDMITRYPDLFAAAVPICGAGDPSKAELIKDLPIWAFHSAGDVTVPSSGSREMVAAIENAGGNSIKYTEFPDDAHDAWTRAYTNEELYTWLFAQSKPVYGDANGDEVIDVRDLVRLKKMLAAGEYSKTADCNKDGELGADDLIILRKHLMGAAPIA